MKKFFLLLLLALSMMSLHVEATAAPCPTSSISAYVALGSTGCTIGSLSFSNFLLRPPQAGAVRSTTINVVPIISGTDVAGVRFDVGPTSSGGLIFDDLITYRVTGVAANLVGSTVDFAGSSATGDAAVSVLEQLCVGGTFLGADGVSGCTTGSPLNLAVIDIGFGPDPAYSLNFGGVGSVGVVSELTFDSGSGFVPDSSSTLTSGTSLFRYTGVRVVPEPAESLLMAVGFLALGVAVRRRSQRSSPRT